MPQLIHLLVVARNGTHASVRRVCWDLGSGRLKRLGQCARNGTKKCGIEILWLKDWEALSLSLHRHLREFPIYLDIFLKPIPKNLSCHLRPTAPHVPIRAQNSTVDFRSRRPDAQQHHREEGQGNSDKMKADFAHHFPGEEIGWDHAGTMVGAGMLNHI